MSAARQLFPRPATPGPGGCGAGGRRVIRRSGRSSIGPAALAALLLCLAVPAARSGLSEVSGGISDPAGDANFVDGAAPGTLPPTDPASLGFADIRRVWFTTDHVVVPARRDGTDGLLDVPQALRLHVETTAPIEPTGPGIVFAADWSVGTLRYRLLVHVPGEVPDSKKAILGWTDDTTPLTLGTWMDLGAPSVSGNRLSASVDLGTDRLEANLLDGSSLASIRAFSAPYIDWHWDHRHVSRTGGWIDFAPSDRSFGYFEIGSDLAPRFEADPAADPALLRTAAGGNHGDGGPAARASVVPWGVSVGPDDLVYVSDFGRGRVRRIDAAGAIKTFAGASWGFSGDGGPASVARMRGPGGHDWGDDGTLYVADPLNQRVRAIAPDGTIRTVAGNGVRAFAGDGGPAVEASLVRPVDVAVSSRGDVFIADESSERIRRVDPSGTISTVAGGGLEPIGDAPQPATAIRVRPAGLAVGPEGDLWVGDRERVVRIDLETGIATRYATGLGEAQGLAFDGDGRLYVADAGRFVHGPEGNACEGTGGGSIVRIDGDGSPTVVAGSGAADGLGDGDPATAATLHRAVDVALGPDGSIFISERTIPAMFSNCPGPGHDRVRVVTPDGTIHTYAGTGHDRSDPPPGAPGTAFDFDSVWGLAYDDAGRLYIAAAPSGGSQVTPASRLGGGRLYRLDPNGSMRLVAGNGELGADEIDDDEGPALATPLGIVRAIDVGVDGRVYVADVHNRQIKVYDPSTDRLSVAAGGAFDFVDGAPQPDEIDADKANLWFPRALAAAPNGDVYWTEYGSGGGCNPSRIRRLSGGKVHFVAGTRAVLNGGCGFGGDGKQVDDTTALNRPAGLAFDRQGRLLIADTRNARIRRYDLGTGTIETVVGDGAYEHRDGNIAELSSLMLPVDVEQTPDGGYLVAESGSLIGTNRTLASGPAITYVAPNGMTTRVAGNGISDATAERAALGASLEQPNAVALSPAGKLAIADRDRVRILTPPRSGWPTPPRTVACLPDLTDIPGDYHAPGNRIPHMNNPSLDLRRVVARESGGELVVEMKVEDLVELSATAPDDDHVVKAWVYLFHREGSSRYSYLAVTKPVNGSAPAEAGSSYERGWAELGSSSHILHREGPAAGVMDEDSDVVTLRAPLAAVGLALGDRVVAQRGITSTVLHSNLLDPSVKSLRRGDHTNGDQESRSFVVGRSCPDGYGP